MIREPVDEVEHNWYWILGFVTAFAAVCVVMLLISNAFAHEDSWINRGNFKNGAGEWCCGDYDCTTYSRAKSDANGWIVNSGKPEDEHVPFDEALPIAPPDGQITICRRPDGSRRCVFGIKPGT